MLQCFCSVCNNYFNANTEVDMDNTSLRHARINSFAGQAVIASLSPAGSTRVPNGARRIFIEFLVRDGWRRRDAAHEFDEFLVCNGVARTKDSYLVVRRTGARTCLTRAQRESVYLTFANAINHATFEA